jgi:ATP-binding cassette subfamily B protein
VPDEVPLIGVDDLEPPRWAAVDAQVAAAGVWRTLAAVPGAVRTVTVLAWRTSPRLTLLVGLVHVLSGFVTALGLLATANVLTELLETGPTPERLVASLPAIGLVTLSFAARGLLDGLVGGLQGALTPRLRHEAQDEVHVAVLGAELAAFDDPDFRELVRQGGLQGVRSIETGARTVADLVSSVISMLAAIITAGVLNPWLAPVLLLAALADGWASMRVAKLGYLSFLRMVSQRMRLNVVEMLMARREYATERIALTLRDTLLAEQRRIAGTVTAEAVRISYQRNVILVLGRTLAGAGSALAYGVLGLLLYVGAMPLALAGTAAVAMRTASSALSSAMHSVNGLYEETFYIGFFRTLLFEARARRRQHTPAAAPADPELITIDAVSFTYPDADEPALCDVSLEIRRGEVIALVGQNGSGKSTLGKLITGLYLPSRGAVRWDGVDLATVDPITVQDNVSVISQEPARWPMTANSNIRVGRLTRPDPDGLAWDEAVRKSGAHEVIDALPKGPDTVLSKEFKDGHELSGGQWQRISVARGIYRDAAILVADEPTAALDAKAEATVFAGLQHATRLADGDRPHRTTILVTHRLANIRHADRIVVLDKGRIIEQGTHRELMANQGLYRELYDIQAQAYLDQ